MPDPSLSLLPLPLQTRIARGHRWKGQRKLLLGRVQKRCRPGFCERLCPGTSSAQTNSLCWKRAFARCREIRLAERKTVFSKFKAHFANYETYYSQSLGRVPERVCGVPAAWAPGPAGLGGPGEQRLPARLRVFAEWYFTQSHSVDNV